MNEKIKVEIASGIRPHSGYIHIDMCIDCPKDVDIMGDIRTLPLKDECADEVLFIHGLEHIFWMGIPWVLAEINRTLKFGGKLFIEVPDANAAYNRLRGNTNYLQTFYMIMYLDNYGDGDSGYKNNFVEGFNHTSCFNEETLTIFLDLAGFNSKRRTDLEQSSVHNWIGIIHMEATKIKRPSPISFYNQVFGFSIKNYKWYTKYGEIYG